MDYALVGYSSPLFIELWVYYLWLSYYIYKGREVKMNKYGFVTRAITNEEKKIVSFIALLLALNMFI